MSVWKGVWRQSLGIYCNLMSFTDWIQWHNTLNAWMQPTFPQWGHLNIVRERSQGDFHFSVGILSVFQTSRDSPPGPELVIFHVLGLVFYPLAPCLRQDHTETVLPIPGPDTGCLDLQCAVNVAVPWWWWRLWEFVLSFLGLNLCFT